MTAPHDHPFSRPPRGAGRWAAGVCAGLAERWDVPVGGVRLAFVAAVVPFAAGVLVYGALALAMPARGATPGQVRRSAQVGRTLLLALRVLGALLVLGALIAVSTAVAVFGLGAVALILAALCASVLLVAPGVGAARFGVAALALTLPATAVALSDVQVARQAGNRTVTLRSPADATPLGFRTGLGDLLVDLREFDARSGSITTVRARADLRTLVVALPTDRCFDLVVDQTLDRRWPAAALDLWRTTQYFPGAPALTGGVSLGDTVVDDPDLARLEAGEVPSLVAFGRAQFGESTRYERIARRRGVRPVLHLVLTTGRSQAIVRDYPDDVRPLDDPWWPTPHVPGSETFGMPRGVAAERTVPDDPLVPTVLRRLTDLEIRARAAAGPGGDPVAPTTSAMPVLLAGVSEGPRRAALERFVRQELQLRAAMRYPDEYRREVAGPCAPKAERSARIPPLQAAARAERKATARWLEIRRRWPQRIDGLADPKAIPLPIVVG
ncbi:MAG: PspC domain-containing protein [Patulibacter minatonensis]